MHYRKEIDGLRAIAVMPVIFFHAGFSGFNGGYIGVDIFFVISGFLITSILIKEMQSNTFSLIGFYERRARRILPALSIVLLFTAMISYLFVPASLLKGFSQSLVSVSLFSSNIFFYLSSGYFSTASDEMPLLHTWSLAIEEQYYFIFPLFLFFLWKKGYQFLLKCIVLIALLSLFYSHFLSMKNEVNANFYLIFSRAWELLLGSILAFEPLKNISIKPKIKGSLPFLGLFLILYSIVFFDEHTPFPSFYTLIPVLGTSILIMFASSSTQVGRLLSTKAFTLIGLLSYSLYLWHQPIFALLKMKTIGQPSYETYVYSIIIIFILSFLSWQFVEKPFRNKKRFTGKSIFIYAAISILFFSSLGLIGHFNNGFEHRFFLDNYAETMQHSPKRRDCHTRGEDYLSPLNACKYYKDNITWATFGDSHTVEVAHTLALRMEEHDIGLLHLSFSACPPSLLFDIKKIGCSHWVRDAVKHLVNSPNIKNVLIGFRYNSFLYGEQLASYPNTPNEDPSLQLARKHSYLNADETRELYWKSFKEVISQLTASGKNIFVLYPIPELPAHINKLVMPFSVFDNTPLIDLSKTTTKEFYLKRNHAIIAELDSLPYSDKLKAIRPFDLLCNSTHCPTIISNEAIYFDDDHLSLKGARILTDSIKEADLLK